MSETVDNPLQAEIEECKTILRALSAALREDNAELCRARAHWAGARTYMPESNNHAKHIDEHLGHSINYRIDIDGYMQELIERLDRMQQLANLNGTEEQDAVTSAERIAREHEDRLR